MVLPVGTFLQNIWIKNIPLITFATNIRTCGSNMVDMNSKDDFTKLIAVPVLSVRVAADLARRGRRRVRWGSSWCRPGGTRARNWAPHAAGADHLDQGGIRISEPSLWAGSGFSFNLSFKIRKYKFNNSFLTKRVFLNWQKSRNYIYIIHVL